MSRNLTSRFLQDTERALALAISIADVTRIARRIAHGTPTCFDADEPTTEIPFSYTERKWFRSPLRGGL